MINWVCRNMRDALFGGLFLKWDTTVRRVISFWRKVAPPSQSHRPCFVVIREDFWDEDTKSSSSVAEVGRSVGPSYQSVRWLPKGDLQRT